MQNGMVPHMHNVVGPADYGFEITPSDTLDLPRITRALYAGGGGVVKWLNREGQEQHTTISDGERVPLKAKRILVTGTTATDLEGLA